MIPLFVVEQFSDIGWLSRRRIWFPIFLIWLILLPIAILLFPIFLIGCVFTRVNLIRGTAACLEVLSALRGLEVEVQKSDQQIFISIK